MASVKEEIKNKASDVSVEMTGAFRSRAIEAGWPQHIVEQLSVSPELEPVWPKELEDQVLDLEYGSPANRPTSVIRNVFTYKRSDFEESVIDANFIDNLAMDALNG